MLKSKFSLACSEAIRRRVLLRRKICGANFAPSRAREKKPPTVPVFSAAVGPSGAKGVLNPRRDWIIGVITRWRREEKSRAPYARLRRAQKPVAVRRFLAVFGAFFKGAPLLRVAVLALRAKFGQFTPAEVYLFGGVNSWPYGRLLQ